MKDTQPFLSYHRAIYSLFNSVDLWHTHIPLLLSKEKRNIKFRKNIMFIGYIDWPRSRGLRSLHRLIPAHILQQYKATDQKYLLILEIIFSQDGAMQTKTWGIILITIHMRKLKSFPLLICTFPWRKSVSYIHAKGMFCSKTLYFFLTCKSCQWSSCRL